MLERPNLNGLFHWAGSEVITRYELGRRILDRFGFSHELILRGSLKDYQKRLGKRPANLTFELSPLIGKIKTKPETISEQLQSLKVPNSLFRWYRENADDPSKYKHENLDRMDIYPKSEDIGIRNMATDWWVFEMRKKPSFRHYKWTRQKQVFGYGQDWEGGK